MPDQAIIVRNARKQYGGGHVVLNDINLNVPRGCIYGLLGASGCGKTTLLSCIVGVKKLDAGDILVLGGRPGNKDSGIPGPRVGYMPQDISLVDEFSVIGALYFFGKINGLDKDTIDERYIFLKDLLQLPPQDRLVKNMSGGQQRRVSFAAALLHKPELLILDEPTVGLDPVLRDNIWNHLVKITQEKQVTVIITTHYIEEAKQANKIGLLRNGQLLSESSPNELLEEWHTDSLEEAFLNLSQLQVQNQLDRRASNVTHNAIAMDSHTSYTSKTMQLRSSWKKRCEALLLKNFYQFVRHPGGILFSFVLPIMQVILFFNSIGLDPKNLKISVVNEEAGNCNNGRNFGNVSYNYDFTCNFSDLSCRFLSEINDSFLKKVYYDSYEEALNLAQKDRSVAIMHFRRNFSHASQARLDDYLSLSEEDIVSGQIEVTIQTADRQISIYLQKKLYDFFFEKYDTIMKQCKIRPKFAKIPVNFEEPIFGKRDQNFVSFAAPIFILLVLFVQTTSLCSSIIITDRHSGVWDRLCVQGVTTTEIIATHLATQVFLTILQTAVAMIIYFSLSDSECKGSIITVILMSLLSGLCGVCYGFTISVVCTSHTLVNYASVGSFYPLVLLSGYVWPVEGMPKLLRWISLALPITKPGISMRDIVEKGSSIDQPEVYLGFIVMATWIICLVTFCVIYLKAKST
ncbi:ABC transporter G family member 20 [Megachile rotundata]|uniref:ABC transporter G family member 20 n=1 Tax=Megachile rotundata TaxID=143995 RepID=UPI003FD30667